MSVPARAACLAAAIVIALLTTGAAGADDGPGRDSFGYGPYVREARAVIFCNIYVQRRAAYQSCLVDQLLRLVSETGNPVRELPRVDAYVHSTGGFLGSHCHVIMHAVGRRYGKRERITLSRLSDYLPRTNDPGCSAGFAHGLITALGPEITRIGPKGAAAACHRTPTRYQRYSCIHGLGHAYARTYMDALLPAIASCKALGPDDAADCAQGAYMDYWMSLAGLDNARRPANATASRRAVCGQAPKGFVRACWYRAYSDHPPAKPIDTASKVLAACRGLVALQRSSCLAGAGLVISNDPLRQIEVCAALPGSDASACVRGIRVPNVARGPAGERLRLIRGCSSFKLAARSGCYEWLGKALNVVTDGRFAREGCSRLGRATSRRACARGARAYEGPLETFS
jgi:hypothetical protein